MIGSDTYPAHCRHSSRSSRAADVGVCCATLTSESCATVRSDEGCVRTRGCGTPLPYLPQRPQVHAHPPSCTRSASRSSD
eukprot:378667-Rhodomonas_salina.3